VSELPVVGDTVGTDVGVAVGVDVGPRNHNYKNKLRHSKSKVKIFQRLKCCYHICVNILLQLIHILISYTLYQPDKVSITFIITTVPAVGVEEGKSVGILEGDAVGSINTKM